MKIVKIKQKDLERIINEQLVNPIQIGKYIYDKYKKLTSSEPKKNEVQGKLPFTDKNLAQEALKFFDWAFRNGKQSALDLDYVPLPNELTNQIRLRVWNQIK